MVSSASTQKTSWKACADSGSRAMATRTKAANAPAFGPGGHEGRHRSRRALIDIGRPGVERHDGGLEAQADDQQREAGDGVGDDVSAAAGQPCASRSSRVRPRAAVDQGDAVQEEAGRERAEQEILHRRLFRPRLGAGKAGQDVQGDGQHFQADKDGDQLAAGRHQHRAGGGEQHQGVILAVVDALLLNVALGQQDGQRGDDQQDELKHQREIIGDDRAVERRSGVLAATGSQQKPERDDAAPTSETPTQQLLRSRGRARSTISTTIAGDNDDEQRRDGQQVSRRKRR